MREHHHAIAAALRNVRPTPALAEVRGLTEAEQDEKLDQWEADVRAVVSALRACDLNVTSAPTFLAAAGVRP